MRVYLVIVEEPFFHPQFVEEIIRAKKKEIIGVTTVPDISPRKSRLVYLWEQWQFFGPWPFFYLGFKTFIYKILNLISSFWPLGRFYSVGAVARHHKVPLYQAINVNSQQHLDYLRRLRPDVIVSAQGQIFKKELLDLPKIACINRHSALLPKYGGLWPVFWAMLHREDKIGVTVHIMEEKIDAGKILAQREIPILSGDSMYSLYRKAFRISALVTLEALEKLEKKPVRFLAFDPQKASYFSFPTAKEASLFRRKGLKFI